LEGKNALVVDDSATSLRILDRMLRNWGLRTFLAANASEAIEILKETEAGFDLLVLDGDMPGVSGFDLARSILLQNPDYGPRIVMACLPGQRSDLSLCRRLGVGASVNRPVRDRELLAAIGRVLADDGRVSEPASPSRQEHGSAPATARALRVLVAEDNPVNQMVAMRMLARDGHMAVVAANGLEALRALQAEHFDVVLMDVQMPDMNGFEATEAIRAREKRTGGGPVQIFAMTASAMTGDRELCLGAGMDGYLSKPIQVTQLREILAGVSALQPRAAV
jgi:CheY-like chemotaxis protein